MTFLYNQLDQRTSMTDGMGITTWDYDGVGRVTAIDDPLNAAVMYDYDAMGNRTKLTYPDGKQLVYVPNALGQIKEVQERIANGWSADQTVHYTYEPNGQLQMAMLPNGVNSYYAYDGVGRLTDLVHESDTANLAEYHYSYDAAGNRVQAVEIVQQPVSTAVPGAPDHLAADQHGYQEMALRWQDHANNETDYLLERSTDGIHWQPVTSLNRDTIRYVDHGLMRHTQYWYRVVGRNGALRAESQATLEVTAFEAVTGALVQTPGVRVIRYSYDPLKRLTAADYDTGAYYHYAYDSNGNRLQEETHLSIAPVMYAYNDSDANRLESVNGVPYTWDDNGNLTSDGQCSYGYDAANRLTGITGCDNTASFAYNGLGDRIQETVNGASTTFALDLAAGLTQVLQDGANTYLYGNGRIMQQTAAQSAYFLGDALGSVRQLADASGIVMMAKDYEPYGEVMGSAGSGATSYGFTGEWNDALVKLTYLRSRLYSPEMGRFLTRDTWQGNSTMPMSHNAWLYGYANPLSYSDPQGRSPIKRTYATYSSQFNNWKVEDADNIWTEGEIERIESDLSAVAKAFARTYNAELSRRRMCGDYTYLSRRGISAMAAFYYIYDGPITIIRSPDNVPNGAWGNFNGTTGADLNDGFDVIKIWRSTTVQEITDSIGYMVHEVGHAFEAEVSTKLHQSVKAPIGESLYLRTYPEETRGGFAGGRGTWQWSPGEGGYDKHDPNDLTDDTDGRGEIFADMFVGWAYNQWETSSLDPSTWSTKGWERANFMNSNMSQWVFDLIDQKLPTWY